MARRRTRRRSARRDLAARASHLCIHAQDHNHDDVHIIGDRVALTALRDTIDRALASGRWEISGPHEPGDDEGYRVAVVAEPGRPAGTLGVALPYRAEWAGADQGQFASPLQVLDRDGRPPL